MPSSRPLRLAALAIALAVAGTLAYTLSSKPAQAPSDDQAATLDLAPASKDGLQALAKMNGQPCAAALSITRISRDDYNLECAIGADGARRAMYLVNLKTGTVR